MNPTSRLARKVWITLCRGLVTAGCLSAALLLSGADAAPADPFAYFTNVRDVNVSDKAKQNYIVLDASIFEHARADLADLRFYAGSTEVPYAIVVKRGSAETTLSTIPILNTVK